MESLLVRLKPYDPRRRHTLRRYLFDGIVFFEMRGWYRVSKAVGDALRGARQVDFDEYSPLAFDICTEEEANALEVQDKSDDARRRQTTDALPLVLARAEARTAAQDEDRARPAARGRRAGAAREEA